MVNKHKVDGNNCVAEIKKKYPYNLYTLRGCQRTLVKMLRENNGNILENRAYHIIDKRCQDMIIEAESKSLPNAEKYRKRQDRIESISDAFNDPGLQLGNYSKINVFLKSRIYTPKVYRISRRNENE